MKIEYRRLNHITIAVPAGEHDKVRAFYGGVLGLKEVERPDALNKVYDLIWYEWMDILLHLEFTPPWTRPAQNRHVGVEVKQIQRVRSYLAQQGAEILEALAVPDRERFYLLDPFGNYFEFIEINDPALPRPFTDTGKNHIPIDLSRHSLPVAVADFATIRSTA
jgi:catechol 2,3-dioxygenase-like lactoylglutathione lyase family enzyme